VHNFFLAVLHRKARASAVSVGSLVMGSMISFVENGTEMAENERDAKATIWACYKEFGRGRKFVPNGIETGVHKFF